MGDAPDHPAQLDGRDLTRRAKRPKPAVRFVTQSATDLGPFGVVHRRRLPGLIPGRIGERIAAFACPAVHQRQAIAHVLCMSRNRRAAVERA